MNKPLRMPFVDDIAINCPCDDCNFDDGCDKCPSVIAGAKAVLERLYDKVSTWGHGVCLDDDCECPYSTVRNMLKELEEYHG